ncbi:hypothetical protein MHYP_G00007120 [Metynnis hypsauchen]
MLGIGIGWCQQKILHQILEYCNNSFHTTHNKLHAHSDAARHIVKKKVLDVYWHNGLHGEERQGTKNVNLKKRKSLFFHFKMPKINIFKKRSKKGSIMPDLILQIRAVCRIVTLLI